MTRLAFEEFMHSVLTTIVFSFLVVLAAAGCSSDAAPAAATPAGVVFNELSAAGGEEWLELYNTGSATVDLGGHGVTDSDETTGQPRIAKAMLFPAGTKLAKGAYLLVLLGKDAAAPGPYAAEACLAGVSVGCFYASFSVSAQRGEAVHLIAADGSVVTSTKYPADLGFEAGSGLSACRVPDGADGLGACTATPGAANEVE